MKIVIIFVLTFFAGICFADFLPNPIRATVSTDLEEPCEIYSDGDFEQGNHQVRGISPFQSNPPHEPLIERTQESAYSGNWAYKVENTSDRYCEFSLTADPDKAQDVYFSCYARLQAGTASVRPFLTFEDDALVDGPKWGERFSLDENWQLLEFTAGTSRGFKKAQCGIEIPPHSIVYIDNASITVPVWKSVDPTGKEIGGVPVPLQPAAPLNICFSIHIESPQNLVNQEDYFHKKNAVFYALAELFHQYDGFLNIQPEIEWALGSELYAPSTLQELAEKYDVTYSTHTHGPVCVGLDGIPYGSGYCNANHHSPEDHDKNITLEDIVQYIDIRKTKFAALSGIPVTDHNGNFDMVNKNLLFDVGVKTLSVFKNKNTQKTYDYLFTNPWRPSNANALTDIETFLTHDPLGKLVYIPGVGSNVTKRHHRVPLKVKRFAGQFLKYVDADRVNAMNLIFHIDAFESDSSGSDYIRIVGSGESATAVFSDEFLAHLGYWEEMLANTIKPLVDAGYMQWATHKEIADQFIAWEREHAAPAIDAIYTNIPSDAAGEQGVMLRIEIPKPARYHLQAPVVVHVNGGFDGGGLTMRGADLKQQGFIEMFFNFPGKGLPGEESGGVYDRRGDNCIHALKDVLRFAMGEIQDTDGKKLAQLVHPVIPLYDNVGMAGWSNGGNATIAAAGKYADELQQLAWIANWESPVGDGMPTAEAGAKGSETTGNPVTNPAYNPDTGEWDLSSLKYNADFNINRHHTSSQEKELLGGFYFDLNGNDQVDQVDDFVALPILYEETGKVFYSERIMNYIDAHGMFPADVPQHLSTADDTHDFWSIRNGEYWIDQAASIPDLKFVVTASEIDHVQTALDHPHVLLQYEQFRQANVGFARLNPDRCYIESILAQTAPQCVDNPAGQEFDHNSIRSAVEPSGNGLTNAVLVAAACCELADRTFYDVDSPQLDAVITQPTHVQKLLPDSPDLFSCYPNPFNSELTIHVRLSEQVKEPKIMLYNMLGQLVQEFNVENTLNSQVIRWNGYDRAHRIVPSGIYFIKMLPTGTVQSVYLLR